MNIKTARVLRDLLSIIIAACKAKNIESSVIIKIDRAEDSTHQQYIIIRFREID